MKKLIAVVLVLAMMMSFMTFTTVSAANPNLEGMLRASNVKVVDANVKVNATIDLSGEIFKLLGFPEGRLADISLDMNMDGNEELTKCDADGKYSISMPSLLPQPLEFDIWIKEDISDINNAQLYAILRMAEIMRADMGMDKEFIYIDYTQIPGFEEILDFSMDLESADIEKLAEMIKESLKAYVSEDVIAELERRAIEIIDGINVEYANGKYSLIMGDAEAKQLFAVVFDMIFDVMAAGIKDTDEALDLEETWAMLEEVGRKIANVPLFDKDRGFVMEITEDGSVVHTEINIDSNYFDIMAAFDPASVQGADTSQKDLYDFGLSFKADGVMSPLPDGYQVNFPELTDENTYDITADLGLTEEKLTFDTAPVGIEYNGESVSLENAPILYEDRTFVPLREIANAFGISDSDITYDEATEKVTIKSGDVEIVMYIGSSIAFVNDELKTLDVPAFTHNDRTYIPVRFVSEMFHKNVDYVDLDATGQGNGIVVMIND